MQTRENSDDETMETDNKGYASGEKVKILSISSWG